MTIFKTARDLTRYIEDSKLQIHFIPTMGALHDGHISLIRKAQEAQETTLCSIFVNPTQFNNASDLKHYPRTIEEDIKLLLDCHCDILFLPGTDDIYPDGMDYKTDVDIKVHAHLLEGHHRPGHFDGVIQVVDRFLDIIKPKAIYLGEKDLQRVQVITQLIHQKHAYIQIVPCPTLREDDGLAKSSRNKRLTPQDRALAPLIYQNLKFVADHHHTHSFAALKSAAVSNLEKEGFKIDYIELIDADSWDILSEFNEGRMALLIAAYLGEVRLIDNILF